jgi:hypothetical protein
VKTKAPRTLRSAALVELRDTISLRHVADPLLTNKDGKQDAKEDDDEKDELHDHGFSMVESAAGCTRLRRVCRLRHLRDAVKRDFQA